MRLFSVAMAVALVSGTGLAMADQMQAASPKPTGAMHSSSMHNSSMHNSSMKSNQMKNNQMKSGHMAGSPKPKPSTKP